MISLSHSRYVCANWWV